MKWLTDRQWRLSRERIAEAAREVGLLWFVFALLDKIVDGNLTFPWFAGNVCLSVVFWVFGMYIELRTKDEQ